MDLRVRWEREKTLYFLFVLSLVFFILAKVVPYRESRAVREEMIRASRIMSEATQALREFREKRGIPIDPSVDINRTGLIGERLTSITTSLGSLQAKRTTTNPNFAGLMVFLLREAGVKRGETIAVGASGSFPALIVAVLSASKAMSLNPQVIASLGASQWGANIARFHWLHMHQCLVKSRIFSFPLIASSLGGEKDKGEDMQEEGRALLLSDLKKSGFPVVTGENLPDVAGNRMNLYIRSAGERKIRAFVNIGGSWANLGTDSRVLFLKPGVVKTHPLLPKQKQGVLYRMVAQDVPVIHLLYIKGLVQRYGLAWDPIPLPPAGTGEMYRKVQERQKSFLFLTLTYLVLVLGLLVSPCRASFAGIF
jgi:poly-gamma-glutamate system protein